MAINLVKGQKIDLRKKDGNSLTSFCVGANWGVIEKSGFFGIKKLSVDLDLSVGLFDGNKELIDIVYFGNLDARGIRHSGDDLVGDEDGDDGLDNEVIEVNLEKLSSNVEHLVFVLNSYNGQDFATIPFASIRLYEGKMDQIDDVVARYNIAQDEKFADHVSMVLGKLHKDNGSWKFSAIGEAIKDEKLKQTLHTVQNNFL